LIHENTPLHTPEVAATDSNLINYNYHLEKKTVTMGVFYRFTKLYHMDIEDFKSLCTMGLAAGF
jgi:hypothetical protein